MGIGILRKGGVMNKEEYIAASNAAIKYAKGIFGEAPTNWAQEEIANIMLAFKAGWELCLLHQEQAKQEREE